MPEGWHPRSEEGKTETHIPLFAAFENAANEARAYLIVKRTEKTPYEVALFEREVMKNQGERCAKVTARLHPAGVFAAFHCGRRHEAVRVSFVRMHRDPEELTRVFGIWPRERDAEASADFDYIVMSLKRD